MVSCVGCGQDGQVDYDASSGSTYCTGCGTVIEENGIVAEITFGENSSGAAIVNGAYVGADQTRAKGIGGRRPAGAGGVESREQTITNGRRKIQAITNALKLPDRFTDMAQRFYTLALNTNFVRGRRTNYVVAACLYIVCRRETTSHMLIDFSDLLQVNVFILGSTYLKLVKELNLILPAIDPSLYISRFASLLEFGEETQQVASDATRLVQRFSRDWMASGRRPAGICGACLLLAARMNNFRRSIEEIVQVVKIADVTLKKRLEEFNDTATAKLSVVEFRSVWLTNGANPPAYNENLRRQVEKRKDETRERKRQGLKVRFREVESLSFDHGVDNDTPDELEGEQGHNRIEETASDQPQQFNRAGEEEDTEDMKGMAMTEGTSMNDFDDVAAEMAAMQEAGGAGLAAEEDDEAADNIDFTMDEDDENDLLARLVAENALEEDRAVPLDTASSTSSLFAERRSSSAESPDKGPAVEDVPLANSEMPEVVAQEEAESAAIAEDINVELASRPFTAISGELAEKEKMRWLVANDPSAREGNPIWTGADPLDDLDEEELDAFILRPDEVKIKERLWMEFNKDYLANVAEKHLRAELDEKPVKKKDRKKRAKPRDSSAPRGATAAESTKQLLKQKKFSKKINYLAFDTLLAADGDVSGITAANKGNNLFDEDDVQDQWDTVSRGSRDSRASSLGPSLSSVGGAGGGVSSTLASAKKIKRMRSRNEENTEMGAVKLKQRLTNQGAFKDSKHLPVKKMTPSKRGTDKLEISSAVSNAIQNAGLHLFGTPAFQDASVGAGTQEVEGQEGGKQVELEQQETDNEHEHEHEHEHEVEDAEDGRKGDEEEDHVLHNEEPNELEVVDDDLAHFRRLTAGHFEADPEEEW